MAAPRAGMDAHRPALRWRMPQLVLVAALIVFAFWLRGRGDAGATTAEAAVTAWFDAAARGDARSAIALATGDFRERLMALTGELGDKGLGRRLAASLTGLRGIAVSSSNRSTPGNEPDARVVVDVELVFPDRNNRQQATLVRTGNAWAIAALDTSATTKPPIPYGTPVDEFHPRADPARNTADRAAKPTRP